MPKAIGKLIIQTYDMLHINSSIKYNKPILEYNSVLKNILVEIKNDYYTSKKVLYNDQVLELKEHRSRNMIYVIIGNVKFASTIDIVDEYII